MEEHFWHALNQGQEKRHVLNQVQARIAPEQMMDPVVVPLHLVLPEEVSRWVVSAQLLAVPTGKCRFAGLDQWLHQVVEEEALHLDKPEVRLLVAQNSLEEEQNLDKSE